MTTARPLPRTLKIQPAETALKLPYPFYVYQTGRVALQSFWRGAAKQVIGFQKDLRKMSIDLSWPQAWEQPQSALGLYPVISDASGRWSTWGSTIAEATMSEQSERTLTRDEAVLTSMPGDWSTVSQIHDRVGDNGWTWKTQTTRAALDSLVLDRAVGMRKRGTRWEFRPEPSNA